MENVWTENWSWTEVKTKVSIFWQRWRARKWRADVSNTQLKHQLPLKNFESTICQNWHIQSNKVSDSNSNIRSKRILKLRVVFEFSIGIPYFCIVNSKNLTWQWTRNQNKSIGSRVSHVGEFPSIHPSTILLPSTLIRLSPLCLQEWEQNKVG